MFTTLIPTIAVIETVEDDDRVTDIMGVVADPIVLHTLSIRAFELTVTTVTATGHPLIAAVSAAVDAIADQVPINAFIILASEVCLPAT